MKNQAKNFFYRANAQIGLNTPFPCLFSFAFYGSSLSTKNVLFECLLLVQKVTAGKLNVSARCNQKIVEILSHVIICLIWYILAFLTDITRFSIERKIEVDHVPSFTTGYTLGSYNGINLLIYENIKQISAKPNWNDLWDTPSFKELSLLFQSNHC